MVIQQLTEQGFIKPPAFLPNNVFYETITGSVAYGVSSDTSDMDIYGFCIPPKDIIFPHLAGEIMGFGTQHRRFDQYQQHHIKTDRHNYDLQIFNIVKYFNLCLGCNPNMVDTLFTPINCVVHSTAISEMVRENRKIFLSKKAWHTFKGYAYSQLHKADIKDNAIEYQRVWDFESKHNIPKTTTFLEVEAESKERGTVESLKHLSSEELAEYQKLYQVGMNKTNRFQGIKINSVDFKFLYHVVRLMDEVEQILEYGDMDLQRAKEELKAIRRGEYTFEQIKNKFNEKEMILNRLYENSKLREVPDEMAIKQLLLNCLEQHYGKLDACVAQPDKATLILDKIRELVN